MGLEIMKRIDFNKMEFRTFIEELEKQFIKKFSIKENQGLEILFKALQEEDDPGQVNYLYYWCKKPIEEREIMEELDTEIKVGELIDTIEFDYPTFHLSMDCFWAEVTKGHLELKEAEAAKSAGMY